MSDSPASKAFSVYLAGHGYVGLIDLTPEGDLSPPNAVNATTLVDAFLRQNPQYEAQRQEVLDQAARCGDVYYVGTAALEDAVRITCTRCGKAIEEGEEWRLTLEEHTLILDLLGLNRAATVCEDCMDAARAGMSDDEREFFNVD